MTRINEEITELKLVRESLNDGVIELKNQRRELLDKYNYFYCAIGELDERIDEIVRQIENIEEELATLSVGARY